MRVQSSKGLIASELKYPWRWELFLRKVEEGLPFTTMDGGEVRIPGGDNAPLLHALRTRDPAAYTGAFREGVCALRGDDPVVLRAAAALHKSPDFGGRGAGHSLVAQRLQMEQIRAALRAVGGGAPVPVFLGRRVAWVVDVVELGGHGKADVALVDGTGLHLARVSLKSARAPREMQQWDGVSRFMDEREVRDFVAAVGALPTHALPVCRSLSSERVRRAALYGVGPEHADVVVASRDVVLRPRADGAFDFSGRVHYYPEVPPEGSGWEPVLFARSSASRRDCGVDGVRFGVFPRAGRRSRFLP